MSCGTICGDLYKGRGTIWVGDLTNGGYRKLGNCSQLQFSHTTETEEIEDFTNPAGGNCSSIVTIDTISFDIQCFDFSACNLALALGGSTGDVTAGTTITDETKSVTDDSADNLIPTDYIMDTAGTITVTGPTGTPVYVLGTDYQISSGGVGIIVLAAGTIPTGTDNLEITYDTIGSAVTHTLLTTSNEAPLYFEGLNGAADGKPVTIEVFRAQFNLPDTFDWIAEDTSQMPLTGEVLSDSTKAGTTETLPGSATVLNVSQFYRIEQQL